MPDSFILLFNLLLAIAPCLVMVFCFLGIVLVFAAVFYLFIRKSRSVSTRVSQDLSQSSQDYFYGSQAGFAPLAT